MKSKGFTMVELLATITILGIISLLAIGGYMRYQYQAQEKALEVLLSLEFYIDDSLDYIENIERLLKE